MLIQDGARAPEGDAEAPQGAPPRAKGPRGRYYQLHSGHAFIGNYLCDKIKKLPTNKCWWRGKGARQSQHHLFVKCEEWKPQGKEMWSRVRRPCGCKHHREPAIRALFDERATRAVLTFLRETKVGIFVSTAPRPARRGGGGGRDGGGGGGPPSPPRVSHFFCFSLFSPFPSSAFSL